MLAPLQAPLPPHRGEEGCVLAPLPPPHRAEAGEEGVCLPSPPPAAAPAPFFSLPNPRVPLTPASAVRRAFVCVRALPAVRAWGCPPWGSSAIKADLSILRRQMVIHPQRRVLFGLYKNGTPDSTLPLGERCCALS